MSEFWSRDLGLTLVTISLVVLIFIISPLREAGVPGRLVFDLALVGLMIYATLVVNQGRIGTIVVIAVVLATAAVLGAGRLHPTLFLQQVGSVLQPSHCFYSFGLSYS
jgi:hypothetical protein